MLASLVVVDSHELFLPSQQPPFDEAAAAAKHVAAHDLQQVKIEKEEKINMLDMRAINMPTIQKE